MVCTANVNATLRSLDCGDGGPGEVGTFVGRLHAKVPSAKTMIVIQSLRRDLIAFSLAEILIS